MLSKTNMTLIERLKWKVSGMVAKTIEEEFDQPSDAILLPAFMMMFCVTFTFAAVATYSNWVHWAPTAFVGVAAGFALLSAIYAVILSISAVVYYKEPTSRLTVTPGDGGVDR